MKVLVIGGVTQDPFNLAAVPGDVIEVSKEVGTELIEKKLAVDPKEKSAPAKTETATSPVKKEKATKK